MGRQHILASAFLATVLCLMPSFLFGQDQDLMYIRLEFGSAVTIENASVKINIFRNPDSSYNLRVESQSMPGGDPSKSLNRSSTIPNDQFQVLSKAVLGIKQADMLGGPPVSLLDGTGCVISIGKTDTSVSYQATSPNYKTDERKLNDFLYAFELILVSAKLDPKAILN